jgi:hypothetical protein
MRYFLLLLALVGCCHAGFAQAAPPAAARPDSLAVAQAAPDTAAAIHRLFAGRRLRRNLIAAGLGAGVFVSAAISSSNANNGGHGSSGYGSLGGGGLDFSGGDFLLLYAIPAAPLILLDYVVYANYSRKREKWVVEEFRAHRLPAHLCRKLKPRYFH